MRKLRLMVADQKISGRDETLATGLYTGLVGQNFHQIRLTHFNYTTSARKKTLLDEVGEAFGESLTADLPVEHQILLDRGEEQSPEDIELAKRMRRVQVKTLVD